MLKEMTNRTNQYFVVVCIIVLVIGIFIGRLSNDSIQNNTGNRSFIQTSLLVPHDFTKTIDFIDEENQNRALVQNVFLVKNLSAPLAVDQGLWGSCTAYQMRYAYLFWLAKNNKTITEPSTSYWYAKSRMALNNTSLSDIGSTTYSTVNIVRTLPTPSENQYPYSSFNIFNKSIPSTFNPAVTLSTGINSAIVKIGDPTGFKQLSLITPINGIPKWLTQANLFCAEIDAGRSVLISILVYSNIMTYAVMKSGVVPSPSGSVIGGHAICLTGYDKTKQIFTFYNSWGFYSGYVNNIPGLFSIPFSYAANSTIDKRVRASISSDWWSL